MSELPQYIDFELVAESIDYYQEQHDDNTQIESVVVYELEAENPLYEDENYWMITVASEKYEYTMYDHTSMAYNTGRVPLAGVSPPRGELHPDYINHAIKKVEPHQEGNEFHKQEKVEMDKEELVSHTI